jgi:hypothetical protein
MRIAIVAAAAALLAAGCETPRAPGIAEPLAVGVNQPKLEDAIEASLKGRDWKIIEHTPGRYVAKIDARDDRPVVIAITYDARTYGINYVDDGANSYGSRNRKVQGAYKRWIDILHRDIETRLRRSA